MFSSINNKINKMVFVGFFVALLFILSFNKYSNNAAQYQNKHERIFIKKILTAKPININTATEQDFVKLKGIGHKRAQQIVAYRAKYGRFKNLADIKHVPGIGQSFFSENKELITLD